jgi:outer membrane immunogenic protein
MRIFIAAGIAGAAFCGASALAADLRTKAPAYVGPVAVGGWSGFYLGGNIGYAWGHSDAVTSAACGPFIPFYFDCGNQALVQASGTGRLSPKGFTGGFQAGLNWQAGPLVYGAELDFGAFDLEASRTASSAYVAVIPGVPFTTSLSIETHWLLTARGRIGWTPTPNMLLYATGGLALTKIEVANSFVDFNTVPVDLSGRGAGSGSETKVGWTIGGGSEWMLASNWTAKAEYLYVDFGDVSASSVVSNVPTPTARSLLTTSSDLTAHVVRVGLNYRFGGPVLARY